MDLIDYSIFLFVQIQAFLKKDFYRLNVLEESLSLK